jgi:hypothetical protein
MIEGELAQKVHHTRDDRPGAFERSCVLLKLHASGVSTLRVRFSSDSDGPFKLRHCSSMYRCEGSTGGMTNGLEEISELIGKGAVDRREKSKAHHKFLNHATDITA